MEYEYFLTSLEVNSSKLLFHSKKDFSASMYKSESNFDFELIIYTPDDAEFQDLANKLELVKASFNGPLKYLTHVPIQVKIQKEYFENSKSMSLAFSIFLNNFLTLYQYFYNSYGVPSFKLDGRLILNKTSENDIWAMLEYKSLDDIDFYDNLQESIVFGEAALDLVCSLAGQRVPLEFNWTLLIDGIKTFYEGNFRQTLINCCTSIEVTVTEPTKRWLQEMTLTKQTDQINNLILEVSNPLKFDFYVNSINPEPYKIYTLEELKTLLSDLKSLNSTRNKVAHQGYQPTLEESKKAIETTSNFLKAIWVFDRQNFYREMKKR